MVQKSNLTFYYREGLFIKLSKWPTTSFIPTDTSIQLVTIDTYTHIAQQEYLKKRKRWNQKKNKFRQFLTRQDCDSTWEKLKIKEVVLGLQQIQEDAEAFQTGSATGLHET